VFHAPLLRCATEFELVAMVGAQDALAAATSDEADLIVISTPNQSHFPLAAAALHAGKHVVVDKPFTVSVAEGEALIDLASRQQRMLTVFHNRRWDGDFLTVRKLLADKTLGEVLLFEAHWDRFRPAIKQGWRELPADGAGVLNDLGPHMIDQALLLFGWPGAVSADIQAQRREALVDDYFDVTFQYGSLRARLCASTMIAEPRPRFAVHGSGGSFVKFGLDTQEPALRDGDPAAPDFGLDPINGTLTFGDGRHGAVPTERGRYRAFYEGVAAAISNKGPAPVDPSDAVAGLRLIECARKSAREGVCVPTPDASSPAV